MTHNSVLVVLTLKTLVMEIREVSTKSARVYKGYRFSVYLGPLMKFTDSYWFVEGIVSFGRACGLEGWPGVYTRVSSFEDWIKTAMIP